MSSDEDDYMSEKWLENIPDVRPGLIKDRVKLRENDVKAKQKINSQIQKQIKKPDFKEKLEQGLSSAIDESNKGFAMLQKMGYKKGESLGKTSTEGIKEPIGIKIKENRSGLGLEAKRKEDEEKKKRFREQILKRKHQNTQNTEQDFKKRMIEKMESRKTEGCFKKCQKVCKSLDETNDNEEPLYKWFWPPVFKDPSEEEDRDDEEKEDEQEEDEYTTPEKFEIIKKYLRDQYCYCFWCGTKYDDEEDLKNCPGIEEDDH
ncbi:GPATCH11 family protein [Megaselia abdita]